MAKDDLGMLEKQLNEAPKLLKQLQAALGTKSKEETIALIREDLAARRIAQKIIRTVSSTGPEPTMNPPAPTQAGGRRGQKAKVEF